MPKNPDYIYKREVAEEKKAIYASDFGDSLWQ